LKGSPREKGRKTNEAEKEKEQSKEITSRVRSAVGVKRGKIKERKKRRMGQTRKNTPCFIGKQNRILVVMVWGNSKEKGREKFRGKKGGDEREEKP